jgi:putative ABC transport system permease protein
LGYGLAYRLGTFAFPLFPRQVLLTRGDLLLLAGIVIGISAAASVLGIWKAMRVAPNTVLA